MKIYCVKCKKKTDTDNIQKITTKSNRLAIRGNCKICGTQKYRFVKNEGEGIDLHKWIGKIPPPSKGFVPPGYNYLGPYNPLESQLDFNKGTG